MDALERIYRDVLAEAKALGFETLLIGRRSVNVMYGTVDDGRLIKIWPIDARPNVFLELEQKNNDACIYRHRTSELTGKYKGRVVSSAWVIKFMQANEAAARTRTKEAQEISKRDKRIAEEIEHRLATPKPVQYRSKCRACEGDGSWVEGLPQDGDTHMVFCPVCHGAGSVPD